MPLPPGLRVVRAAPGSGPGVARGGSRTSATGGWKMARRATSALSAVLACAALALSVTVLGGHQPAAAATAQRADGQLSIVITGMTPQWARPRSTVTLSGTLRNNSKTPVSQLTVQLYGSSTPVAYMAQLQGDASQQYTLAPAQLPGATWQATAPLAPGASADWSIRVPASAFSMTAFGVYPLAAQAQQFGTRLATATTFLPYEPDPKGTYARSRPTPAKIAWLWPVIDSPLLDQRWQDDCSGPQASALVQSLGQNGRLGALVRAGSADQEITWVIDPAVLANVRTLTTCQGSEPRWAKAASAWLTTLKDDTSGRPLTVTPYGDPNVTALITVGRANDVSTSFNLGRSIAEGILNPPDLTRSGTAGTATSPAAASGIAWSAAGVPGYHTLENLAADGVRTLVLSSSAFPGAQYSVLKTLNGGGGCGPGGCYMTALLASQSLTQLLGSQSSAPGSAFATGQLFLAETALLAQQQVPAQPIVVAPPPRWAPSGPLAAGLLADTESAPWLRQVTLASLASARHIPIVLNSNWPPDSVGLSRITRPELHKLLVLEREIRQLQNIRARPDPGLFLAVSALESSAWQGGPAATPDAMLATVAGRIDVEQRGVRIIAERRITLGGLKGSVPVSIDNGLGYAVRVQLQLQYSQATGVRIAADPPGLITVPPHQTQTIRLKVQSAQTGSTTVTMLLASKRGDPVSVPLRMTIQATRVGILGMIIFAAALGVFLIASAARALRRGHAGASGDKPAADAADGDHDRAGSADPAGADTVNAERAELGAVGKPAP
ncbi:MAG TPA: DUF6049 family protein [Streptosporangiaceae bacterium]|nr:DUF6049 family protein [Streptosporangiaceae bacterium]